VNSIIALRALAARISPHPHRYQRRRAARRTAIRLGCSKVECGESTGRWTDPTDADAANLS